MGSNNVLKVLSGFSPLLSYPCTSHRIIEWFGLVWKEPEKSSNSNPCHGQGQLFPCRLHHWVRVRASWWQKAALARVWIMGRSPCLAREGVWNTCPQPAEWFLLTGPIFFQTLTSVAVLFWTPLAKAFVWPGSPTSVWTTMFSTTFQAMGFSWVSEAGKHLHYIQEQLVLVPICMKMPLEERIAVP